MRYRLMRVDGGLANVIARYHTRLDALWERNDPGHTFGSATNWAASLHVNSEFDIPFPETDAMWEWDQWTSAPGSGNLTLGEFADLVNEDRERLRRRHRPVGPPITEHLLWNSLLNAQFRDEALHHEAESGGSAEDVRILDENPNTVYVRLNGRFKPIFVPAARVHTTGPTAAVPLGEDNPLHVQPHWMRILQEKLFVIRSEIATLKGLLRAKADSDAQFADTLASFSRLTDLLRICVEGRNEGHFASSERYRIDELAGLGRDFHAIETTAAQWVARQREAAVPASRITAVANSLGEHVRSGELTTLLERALRHGEVVNDDDVVNVARRLIFEAYEAALPAGAAWAHEGIEAAMHPTTTTAQRLPLYFALVTPLVGNTPGPASVWVLFTQFRATRVLQNLIAQPGSVDTIRANVDRLITRFLGYAKNMNQMSVEQYEGWIERVQRQETQLVFRSQQASPEEWLREFEEWQAVRNGGEAGESLAATRERIMNTLWDTELSVAQKRDALARIAREEVTPRVNTSGAMSAFVLVLNLALIACTYSQLEHGDAQLADVVAGVIGGSLAASTAFVQILANRNRTGFFATVLEETGTVLGHLAAALALLQSIAGVASVYRDWGWSHPMAMSSAIMSLGSAAMLWAGMFEVALAASFTGIGLVLGIGAAIVALIGDEDPAVKLVWLDFVNQLKNSSELRRLNHYYIAHGGRQPDLIAQLHQIRERAQHMVFVKPVWNEDDALRKLGFSHREIDLLTDHNARIDAGRPGRMIPAPST